MFVPFAVVTERFRFRHGLPGWDDPDKATTEAFPRRPAGHQRRINHNRFNSVNQRPAGGGPIIFGRLWMASTD
jgi:hypothetical protein